VPVRGTEDLAGIIRDLGADGVHADDVAVHPPTLNDVFFALTENRQAPDGTAAPVPEARS
jgi:hypothetical protein